MIKNIILDMGNVLLDFNPEVSLKKFCRTEEERNLIRNELFLGPEWALGDKGEIKDRDRYDIIKNRIPRENWPALRQCAYNWEICMKPVDGAKEFCDYVKGKGYKIFVLSNASDLFYTYFPNFAPFDFFNGIFVSSDYLMLKPDLEIFIFFLKKFNLTADECLFIDDKSENVQSAQKAGMQGVIFQNNYPKIQELFHL